MRFESAGALHAPAPELKNLSLQRMRFLELLADWPESARRTQRHVGSEIAALPQALARAGARVGEWSHYTGRAERTQGQLLELGVEIRVSTALGGFDGSAVTFGCVYSGRQWQQNASAVVLVTSREPREEFHRELVGEDLPRLR